MDPSAAPVLEVFASYQGEGLFVGQPQTFLRLSGCPLRCRYCDTPHSRPIPEREANDDWLTPFGAMLRVAEVELNVDRPIAVTGGEPLIWPGFLLGLRKVAGDRALHLETAGHDLAALEAVGAAFDHISLDLKLPGDLARPARSSFPSSALPESASDWDALRVRQLDILTARGASACLKLVVTPGTDPADFEPLLADVARLAPELPLFVAPASPREGSDLGDLASLDGVVAAALEAGLEPRVLSQLHRALGVR